MTLQICCAKGRVERSVLGRDTVENAELQNAGHKNLQMELQGGFWAGTVELRISRVVGQGSKSQFHLPPSNETSIDFGWGQFCLSRDCKVRPDPI